MAIAQRIYKTQLSDDEYEEMMDCVRNAPVKPYNMKKERLHWAGKKGIEKNIIENIEQQIQRK